VAPAYNPAGKAGLLSLADDLAGPAVNAAPKQDNSDLGSLLATAALKPKQKQKPDKTLADLLGGQP
jgi:hypothetical protein